MQNLLYSSPGYVSSTNYYHKQERLSDLHFNCLSGSISVCRSGSGRSSGFRSCLANDGDGSNGRGRSFGGDSGSVSRHFRSSREGNELFGGAGDRWHVDVSAEKSAKHSEREAQQEADHTKKAVIEKEFVGAKAEEGGAGELEAGGGCLEDRDHHWEEGWGGLDQEGGGGEEEVLVLHEEREKIGLVDEREKLLELGERESLGLEGFEKTRLGRRLEQLQLPHPLHQLKRIDRVIIHA